MNSVIKRSAALLLAFLFCFSTLPAYSYAETALDEVAAPVVEEEPEEEPEFNKIEKPRSEPEFGVITYINPIYEDVITEEDLPESSLTAEDLEAIIDDLGVADDNLVQFGFAAPNQADYSIESAGLSLREGLINRDKEIEVTVSVSESCSDIGELCWSIYSVAVAHNPANPVEGDYLLYEYGGYNAYYATVQGRPTLYIIKFAPLYYTSAEQEAELDRVVEGILDHLNIDEADDYTKIYSIYDYLCQNVAYDHANLYDTSYLLKYTAYAALVNRCAVCQGYSAAFYRMCLASGVDCRIVDSETMNHAWNIVRYRDNYYELDATWDAGTNPADYFYYYFLRGKSFWLNNHRFTGSGYSTLGDRFGDAAFSQAYPIPPHDAFYTIRFNPNGGTDAPESVYLPLGYQCTVSPEDYPGRQGYKLAGWSASGADGDICFYPRDPVYSEQDTELFAVWVIPGNVVAGEEDDGENPIDVQDVLRIRQYIAGVEEEPLSPRQRMAADVYEDGRIDLLDASFVMRHVVGLYNCRA